MIHASRNLTTISLKTAGFLVLAAGLTISGCATRKPKPVETPVVPGQASSWKATAVDVSRVREDAITTVTQISRSDDAQLRANAVEAASFAPQRLKDILDAGLTDRIAGVRSVAASAVGRAQIRPLVNKVKPLINDKSDHVKASAIYAMLKNGERADQSPLAVMLMSSESPWVSRQAAYVLGELGNRSALPMLRSASASRTNVLEPSQQRAFQLQVIEAMVKLGEQDQLPALRAALYPSQVDEFDSAVLAIQILGELRDREAIGQLTSILQYTDKSGAANPPEMRLAAAGALARMGVDNAAAEADQYVTHPSAAIRAQAASVYGNHPGPKYWDRLKALMTDKDPMVRISAAAGVLKSGTK
ncbi:MAG: hypothetical protein U0640_10160 [Phycisphaerales bacterium]